MRPSILLGTAVCTDNVLHFICVWILEAQTACPQPDPFTTLGTEPVNNRHHLTLELQNWKTQQHYYYYYSSFI